jgi:hypothetical protein
MPQQPPASTTPKLPCRIMNQVLQLTHTASAASACCTPGAHSASAAARQIKDTMLLTPVITAPCMSYL